MLLVFMISTVSFALAEDNDTEEPEDTTEIEDEEEIEIEDELETEDFVVIEDITTLEDQDDTLTAEVYVESTEADYEETYETEIEGASEEDLALISDDTTRELRVMNEFTGAKVRMLQLERAARVNFAKANAVMNYITTTYPDEDVSTLKEIMDSVTSLAEEVKAYDPSQYEAQTNIDQFISWKKQGQELTSAFREESNKILSEEDKLKLRLRFLEIEKKAAEMIEKQIKLQLKEHNAEVTQKAMERMGMNNQALVQKIKAGEIDPAQIKAKIRTEYNSLNQEQKAEVKIKLQEKAFEERKQRIELINEAKKKEIELTKEIISNQRESIKERLKFFEEQKRQQIRQDVVGDARSRAMAMSFNGNGNGQRPAGYNGYNLPGNGGNGQ